MTNVLEPQKFGGIVANLLTAFEEKTGELDLVAYREHVEWVVAKRVHGVSCLLSAGEFAYLDARERLQVIESTAKAAAGKVPVTAGVTADNVRDTVNMAKAAYEVGVDCVLVQPRSYFKLTDAEVLAYFEAVIQRTGHPIGIYNNPATTGFDISAGLYKQICKLGAVPVTKEGSGDLLRTPQLLADCPDLVVLNGTENLFIASMAHGAQGSNNGIAAVLPTPMLRMYTAMQAGDILAARSIYDSLLPLMGFIRKHGVFRACKAMSKILGRPLGGHRLPLLPLTPAQQAELATIVNALPFTE